MLSIQYQSQSIFHQIFRNIQPQTLPLAMMIQRFLLRRTSQLFLSMRERKIYLEKSTLIWYKGQKKKTYKNVKSFAIIENTKNLIFITKKGAADIVSFKNGKKKRLIEKGAKKIIYINDYGVEIKTASKKIDIRNK